MKNISEILKEAKPLYFQRKRRRIITKTVLSLIIPIFIFSGFFGLNYYNEHFYIAMCDNSAIEEMGLPVDDYGFLEID